MKLWKGLLITLVIVGLGLTYLYLAMVGPLQSLNIGFGLTQGLSEVKLPGGYSLANLVLFLVLVVILVVLGVSFLRNKKV